MRPKKTKLPLLLTLLFMTLSVSIQWGCDSYPTKHKPTPTYSYRFEGVLVKDLNVNFTRILASFKRNDSILPGAEISFGGDSLAYSADSTYYRTVFPASAYQADSFDIEIRDSSFFHDTVITNLAGNFAIETIVPPRREKTPSETVSLTWTDSADTQSYVMAAVKLYSSYTGTGHSQYVTTHTASGTFDNDAFASATGEPDTGWYYLYVYSYVGSPDSALSATLLPVPMPSQLADNIDENDLEGRFGTILVAVFDSIKVVVQPP